MQSNQLSQEAIFLFCEEIGMFLKAGIPISEGLELLEEEIEDKNLKILFHSMREELAESISFDTVLEDVKCFPAYMIHMVKIGLEAGKLDEVMVLLSRYYKREHEIKESIKKAITYPLILMLAMGALVLVLSIKVLPVFEDILRNLGVQLSGVASGLMKLGMVVSSTFIGGLIILVLVLGLGWLEWKKHSKDSRLYQYLLRFKCYEKLELQRLTSAMSLMMGSGVSSTSAMQVALEMIQHEYLRIKLSKCLYLMEEGKTFTEAIDEVKLLGNLEMRMLRVGVKTGYLDEAMFKVAYHYEEEVEAFFERWIGKVEPTAIILLAVIIGSILLSVMVPLMSIMSSIG